MLLLTIVAAGCGGSSSAGDQTLKVTLVDEGCSPAKLEASSGRVTFEVENGGTSKVDEFEVKKKNGVILGEQEDIVGAAKGSVTLTLRPGKYVLSCPNGESEDQGELVVSG